MCNLNYEPIRNAMNGEPFTMSLTDTDEIEAVIDAVNQGIDSHLEACFCPERGDEYSGGKREAGRLVLCRTLDCTISPDSLPVLLRRLLDGDDEAGYRLANDILNVLGFDENGNFVGREALELA